MLVVPPISDYKPFYIQTQNGESAIDIKEVYSVIIKAHDYPLTRTVKTPYNNAWFDEHGDDEYLGPVYFEAFTFRAECVMLARDSAGGTAEADLVSGVRAFENFLCTTGPLRIFDSWTGFGFRDVRLVSVTEGKFDRWDNRTRVIFTVEFKVNDPATRMVLYNGSIVDITTARRAAEV